MTITFEQYNIDTICLGLERLLSQFSTSTTGIQPFTIALTEQTQDWNNISQSVFVGRYLPEAIGDNLDVIGRIVGQPRPYVDGSEITYFAFDKNIAGNLAGWDKAPWFVLNAPDDGDVLASDTVYRQYLSAKIFKNQVTGATPPELKQFVKNAFDIEISTQTASEEPLAIDLFVPSNTTNSIVRLLMSKTTTNLVENSYFIPVPCCTRIISITLLPSPAFAFDNEIPEFRAGWDSGKWAIRLPAETFE